MATCLSPLQHDLGRITFWCPGNRRHRHRRFGDVSGELQIISELEGW